MADMKTVEKLLEAQRLYQEHYKNSELRMRVVYEPQIGYKMAIDGREGPAAPMIPFPAIKSFAEFTDIVLRQARDLSNHREAGREVDSINQILWAGKVEQ